MTKAEWQGFQTHKKNKKHPLEPNGILDHHRYALSFLCADQPDNHKYTGRIGSAILISKKALSIQDGYVMS